MPPVCRLVGWYYYITSSYLVQSLAGNKLIFQRRPCPPPAIPTKHFTIQDPINLLIDAFMFFRILTGGIFRFKAVKCLIGIGIYTCKQRYHDDAFGFFNSKQTLSLAVAVCHVLSGQRLQCFKSLFVFTNIERRNSLSEDCRRSFWWRHKHIGYKTKVDLWRHRYELNLNCHSFAVHTF